MQSISRLAIDEAKAAGHDMFRIGRGGQSIVAVSDRVGEKIIEHKFTGLVMKKPEDWRFGM